ncbi:MAG: hypothetical protein OXJ64_01540 [Boseongicola sp.]|nr:hypothetical protein [Boseongicola sp.]
MQSGTDLFKNYARPGDLHPALDEKVDSALGYQARLQMRARHRRGLHRNGPFRLGIEGEKAVQVEDASLMPLSGPIRVREWKVDLQAKLCVATCNHDRFGLHSSLLSFVTKNFSGHRHGNVSSAPGVPPTSKRVGVGPDLRELWNVPHVHDRFRRCNTLKLYLIESATR